MFWQPHRRPCGDALFTGKQLIVVPCASLADIRAKSGRGVRCSLGSEHRRRTRALQLLPDEAACLHDAVVCRLESMPQAPVRWRNADAALCRLALLRLRATDEYQQPCCATEAGSPM